jgi:DNA-binding transcriptional ArsR family regulator
MTTPPSNPYEGLQRAFHEPKRLAIMAALIGTPSQEMTFTELKAGCDLTDGNLNRHLKTLEEAGAVAFRRSPGPGRTQTIVCLTKGGHSAFLEYLLALEEVLRIAAAAAKPQATAARLPTALPRGASA